MKRIKIKFVDFWPNFNLNDDPVYAYLSDSEEYEPAITENPDYLVYSCFGNEHMKYNNCIKIFYTGENQFPDFNECDYGIGFDYCEFGDRYFRFPFFYHRGYKKDYELMTRKHEGVITNKNGFCSFVYSNNHANPIRNDFFMLLSKYKPVDSGGRFLNNVGGGYR